MLNKPTHFLNGGLWVLLALLFSTSSLAESDVTVMSVPYALSGENIYKVRVESIDGVSAQAATRYNLSAGRHVFGLSMLLQVEWDPDLSEQTITGQIKELELDLQAGMTYQIGARLDPDAPLESQIDQSYWQPILYRKYSR